MSRRLAGEPGGGGAPDEMDHIAKIAAKLKEEKLDAMLLTSEPGEYYALGFHGEGVVLVMPEESWYYTDGRYIEAAERQIKTARVVCLRQGQRCSDLVRERLEASGVRRLGFEDAEMSVRSFEGWKSALSVRMVPASALTAGLRAAKDEEELEAMAQAQRITDETYAEILDYLRPGLTEREVAARLTWLMTCKGAEGNSFDPIVAAGPNGSKPHAVPGDTVLERNMFVTMDFGCKYRGYCSDMTRTVALGKPTEEMARVYDIVLSAQAAGIAAVHAGVRGSEVDAAARAVIAHAGYGDCFGHSFGHSLGIEIHESPNFSPSEKSQIPAGAVVSAEPGIYLPGRFGVRVEDVVVVTQDGCRDITGSDRSLTVL